MRSTTIKNRQGLLEAQKPDASSAELSRVRLDGGHYTVRSTSTKDGKGLLDASLRDSSSAELSLPLDARFPHIYFQMVGKLDS